MKSLCVLDFGTSKIKSLTCNFSESKNLSSKLDFVPVSIGKLLINNIELTTDKKLEILKDFCDKTTLIIEQFLKDNFEIKAIATEIFRKNKELEKTLKKITDKFNIELEILDPQKEAEFLAGNFDLNDDDLLIDVGGGSIQTIYKNNNKLEINYYPIGTYILANLFQPNKEIFNSNVCLNIDNYIKKSLLPDINKYKDKFTNIILGSNQMFSFFSSLSEKTNLNFLNKNHFDAKIINSLINNIFLNKKYEDLFYYFEKNPNFIYGADKMLLILKNFIEITNAKIILPVDDGISSGFAKLHLKKQINN